MWWLVWGKGGTSPPKRMPGSERSYPERNRNTGSDGKPTGILEKGGGGSGFTDVPSGTDRGCLGSDGKPTGLLE